MVNMLMEKMEEGSGLATGIIEEGKGDEGV